MSKMPSEESQSSDDLLTEYHFDYQKAKPNRFTNQRFANQSEEPLRVVVLDEDVAQVFTTAESVNKALRAIIEAMPKAKT